MKNTLKTGLLAATFGVFAVAQSGSGDMTFAKKAAMGGIAEVEMGRLATQNAGSEKVKQFGQRMVDDHSKANDQLKSIASKNSMQLPTDADPKDKAMMDRMSKLHGAEFDKAYMKDMVKDHTQDVADFRKESTSGSNADLKGFAASTLPTLEEHLRMAKEAAASVGAGGGSTSR